MSQVSLGSLVGNVAGIGTAPVGAAGAAREGAPFSDLLEDAVRNVQGLEKEASKAVEAE